MKKLTKFMSIAVAGVMAGACFAGCGGNGGSQDSGKTSLSIGNWPGEEANKAEYDRMMGVKENFEAANTDIEIVPDEWGYDVQTFLPKAEGGTLPNLYTTHFTEAKKIIDLGYSADVTDAMKKYGYYDKLSDFVMKSTSKDGKIYLIPESVYTLGLMLNLDLFEQAGLMEEDGTPIAPKTFDELIETARTITEKTGKAGFIFPTTENAGGWNFTVLAWNFGVSFMEERDGKWVATFNSPECAEALQYIKDLKWKYHVLPESTLVNNNETVKQLGTGQAAMMFAHPGQAKIPILSYGLSKDSLGFAQMPAGKDKHVTLIGGAYRALANNASAEQIDGAFRWLEYVGVTPNLTEESKKNIRSAFETQMNNGQVIGIKDLSIWSDNSEVQAYKNEVIDELCNININHVKLYNDKSGDMDYQLEEPMCAQDLYSILDKCIQDVLTNENADCAALLEKANSDFQKNYLDYEN